MNYAEFTAKCNGTPVITESQFDECMEIFAPLTQRGFQEDAHREILNLDVYGKYCRSQGLTFHPASEAKVALRGLMQFHWQDFQD